jgi:phage shock protein PspC (stress-responsive transcriptional regulator)
MWTTAASGDHSSRMDDHPEGREEPMAQQTEPAPAPPAAPPPRPHKRLYRRTDEKVIAGVASGLADYFEIDPVLVRIGFVILAIAGGAGIIAYGVMWWMVPPSHEVSNPGEDVIRRLKRAPTWVAVGLLVVGGVLLANQLGPRHEDLVWGLGLIALGVLLFWHTSQRGHRPPVPTTPVPPPTPASPPRVTPTVVPGSATPPAGIDPTPTEPFDWRARSDTAAFEATAPASTPFPTAVEESAAGEFGEPAATPPIEPPPRLRPKRPRSGLGAATFGLALVAVGVAALLDHWGAVRLSLAQFLALPLTILAGGLLIGAWVGRARWLAVFAALLVPFVLVASLVNVPFIGGFGTRTFAPHELGDGTATYRLVAGRMFVDLSGLGSQAESSSTRLHVTVSEVAGAVEVILPPHVPVHVDARVGAGVSDVLGVKDQGLSIHRRGGAALARSWIDLDLAVSFGKLVVVRAG